MHLVRASLAVLLAGALAASPAFAKRTHHTTATAAHKTKSSHAAAHRTALKHGRTTRSTRRSRRHILHGQQAIQPERVTQIQQALIKAHYLNGEADGQWDTTTVAAMQKYQADHGWQTRLMPDSRALKSLGLGPDYSNALNASGASFTPPAQAPAIPADEQAGFAEASGVNR
ncbi:MAG: peptidoglycan-binding domain-containing protein [Acidobacteriota bacterium]